MTSSVSPALTDKRQQIIEAASHAFLEKGYQHASMESIAHQAGVAKQTLYNHFGNKDALFVAVVESLCQCGHETMRQEDIRSDEVEAALQQYAQRKLADLISASNTALYRMMIAEAMRFPRLGELFFNIGMEEDRLVLVSFLQRQQQNGNLKVDDPEQAALFFQGALNAYFRPRYIMTGKKADPDSIQKHIQYCIDKFLQLYRP